MQPGSGFGQTNFLLLIVPVLKLPLQLLIHHLGNWQHLTKIPVCVCVCVCSYFTVCLCFRLCVRPCVVYVSLCVHMCPYIFSCFCPRLRLFTRRLSFLLRPICLLLLACFVCCCSRRSHPPPPLPSPLLLLPPSLHLFHLPLCICLIVSPSHFTRQESPRQLLSICSTPPFFSPSSLFKLPLSPLRRPC